MKKLIALLLAALTAVSLPQVVFAANTTTLTATVPPAQYTLNIPADQTIAYGTLDAEIGNVTVTDSSGFAEGKNIQVTITYTEFASQDVSTKIPFTMYRRSTYTDSYYNTINSDVAINSGDYITFHGDSSGAVGERSNNDGHEWQEFGKIVQGKRDAEAIGLKFSSADWGKALSGDYAATITFTAEVVVED
jgi:hypothetical protein